MEHKIHSTMNRDSSNSTQWNQFVIAGYLRIFILPIISNLNYIPSILIQLITAMTFNPDIDNKNVYNISGSYATYWDETNIHYISPKYKNLKDELFSNIIHKITKEQWNKLLRKTIADYNQWQNKLKARNSPKWNTLFHIKPDTVMDIKHLVVVKFCLLFEDIHERFMDVQRQHNIILKQEIAHFSRLLTETVYLYGRHWSYYSSDNNRFKLFGALNRLVKLNGVYPTINYPLMTNEKYYIGQTFTQDKEIVLEFDTTDAKGPIVFKFHLWPVFGRETKWLMISQNFCIKRVAERHLVNKKANKWIQQNYNLDENKIVEKIISGSFLVNKNGKCLKKFSSDLMKLVRKYINEYVQWKLFDYKPQGIISEIFNGFMDDRKYIYLNLFYFDMDNTLWNQMFFDNRISEIYLRYNGYKLIPLPCLKWIVYKNEYDKLSDEGVIKSNIFEVSVDHLIGKNDDCGIIAFQLCMNSSGEIKVNIVGKTLNIKNIQYEYEVYCKSMPYYLCGQGDSMGKLPLCAFDGNDKLDIKVVIRIINITQS
eukprot:290993_1